MTPYLGEIRLFSGNYAPEGWALCNGAIVPISGNEALFSLISTTYGGDGVKTFGLPDLRGRVPMGQGQGVGLTPRTVGQKGGASIAQVTEANMPGHTHVFSVSSATATLNAPSAGASLAVTSATEVLYVPPADVTSTNLEGLSPDAVSTAPGSSGGHSNVMPYLAIQFIIATTGLYPERN